MNKKQWQAWAKKFSAKATDKPTAKTGIEFRNQTETGTPVEILIYGDIGESWFDEGCVTARDFALTLGMIPQGREITVRINSCGGNVWDGWAIYNMLAARKQNVTVVVEGIAASIASVIALAGKEVKMAKASIMMIHDASGMCIGTADDMTEMAAALQKHTDIIAGLYSDKCGKTAEEMKSLMSEETWLSAQEAVDLGLADSVIGGEPVVTVTTTAPEDKISVNRVVVGAVNNQTTSAGGKATGGAINNTMNRKQVIALLNKLGIKHDESATDEQLAELCESYTPPVLENKVTDVTAEVQRNLKIRDAVQKCADELRIPGNKVEAFTARVLADETFLAELQALPPRNVGGDPLPATKPEDKPKQLKRSEFNALKDSEKMSFCAKGGRIVD